jgi:hypothetical protein
MNETPPADRHKMVRRRRSLAGLVVLVILAAVAGIAFHASRQPADTAWPGSVMLVGAGAVVVALASWMRSSGVMAVLETIWDAICGLLSFLGAIVTAIWNGFLSLIGWD